ncbi:MAG: type II CAAX endopeptidase family protein [Devosia sp.]
MPDKIVHDVWRPLLAFCGLAVAISWILWLPLVVAGVGAGGPIRYLHLLGGLGPAVAAIACAWWFGGRPALCLIMRRGVLWQVPLRWHLVAWLAPFVLLAVALVGASIVAGETLATPFARNQEFPDLPLLAYWIVVLVCYGFGEEIGWRGFALPLLQKRFSPAIATLILTFIWAMWHLPLFWFSPGLSSLGLGGTIGWFASLLTGAAILTWLTNATRGSILLAAVFHTTMDLAFSPSISPLATTLIGAAVTVWGIAALAGLLLPSRATAVTLPLKEIGQR